MAEIGLLPLARVALQVATRVLPPYRAGIVTYAAPGSELLASCTDADAVRRGAGEFQKLSRVQMLPSILYSLTIRCWPSGDGRANSMAPP
jgi:hypothetical protein